MNPLHNLIGIKFKNLEFNELFQVVYNFLQENKYFEDLQELDNLVENNDITNIKNLRYWFTTSIVDIYTLKENFKFWVK